MFYFMSQQIDEGSKTDLTLYRSAHPDIKKLLAFGNHQSRHGIESAMPLFREVTFTWDKYAVNPIGDIMSGSIFSPRAAEMIRQLQGEFRLFESINIEGTPAFYISVSTVHDLSSDLDFFHYKPYGLRSIVSERFKDAWEAAGLLGAEFEPVVI